MSILKRLLFSNIAIVILPIIALFLIDIILYYFLTYIINLDVDADFNQTFIKLRFIGMFLIIILINGLLTFYVSKSILNPVKKLSKAAEQIKDGDFDTPIKPMGEDELGKLAETFELMRIRLKQSAQLQDRYDQNRKELIANISHDLKTPITSIKGYIEGIRDGVADSPGKMERYIQTIYTKANDMDHLIDELFLFSKLDLSSVPFHFEPFNLQAYFTDLIEELQFDVGKDGISIALAVDGQSGYGVYADREQLKRIVSNIIQNSVKYMEKKEKKINVYLKANLVEATIQVKDNGEGISEEAILHIFEQFYRADSSRAGGEGRSGLGLAIVKRIVEQHGGRVWAKSEIGTGTSIFFTLPISTEK